MRGQRHLIDAAGKAVGYAEARDRTALDEDQIFRPVLTKLVEIVGEAAKQVTAETRQNHPEVPWSAAATSTWTSSGRQLRMTSLNC